jgi:hypothetical protein
VRITIWFIVASLSLQIGSNAYADADVTPQCNWHSTQSDFQPCLQSALDNAAKENRVVRIPPGTWMIGRALTIPSHVMLKGNPNRSVIKPTDSNSSDPVLLAGTNISDIKIDGIVFDGGGSNFANTHAVIKFSSGDNLHLDRITVQHTRGIALVMQGGIKNSGVNESEFIDIGNHWKVTRERQDRIQGVVFCCGKDNKDNYADKNSFRDVGLDALQISNQDGFEARDNVFVLENHERTIVSSGDYPAAIFSTFSKNVNLQRNKISGAQGNGIDAPGLQDSIIADNEIRNSGAAGIGLFLGYDKQTPVRNVTLSHNTIMSNGQWGKTGMAIFNGGISLSGGTISNVKIEDNIIGNDRTSRTQNYGVVIGKGTVVNGLRITNDNRFIENAVTPFNFRPGDYN